MTVKPTVITTVCFRSRGLGGEPERTIKGFLTGMQNSCHEMSPKRAGAHWPPPANITYQHDHISYINLYFISLFDLQWKWIITAIIEPIAQKQGGTENVGLNCSTRSRSPLLVNSSVITRASKSKVTWRCCLNCLWYDESHWEVTEQVFGRGPHRLLVPKTKSTQQIQWMLQSELTPAQIWSINI